jgi:hypothetical protein
MSIVDFAKPRALWSVSALAREFGMDRRTAKSRLESAPADGELPTGHPGYFVSTAAPYLIGRPVAEGDEFDPDQLLPQDRLAYWRSEHEKLKVAQERRDLLSRIEVEREFARFFELVGRFYDTLPDQLERDGVVDARALTKLEQVLDKHRDELYQSLTAEADDGADRAAG